MAFHEDDLRIHGIDPDTVTSAQAWWRVAIVGGDYAPGSVLVLDEVRRTAGFAGGLTADDVRFRERLAAALNQMLKDVGEDALIPALREGEHPLRLSRLGL